jgi:hypothetical protein
VHRVTGPQAHRDAPARPVLDHAAALARADRILVTAHPAESPSTVAIHAAEGALESCVADGARADEIAACRERLRAVAALLPPDP